MTREQEFRKQTEEAKFEAFSVMCEKVNELEKENAELKSIADFQTSSNMDRYFQLKRSKEQLTKAKKIIENLLNAFVSNDFFEEEELSAMEEAEQLLKEIKND